MNITKEEIDMCKKAEDIQFLWDVNEPSDGDLFAVKKDLVNSNGEIYAKEGEVYNVSYYLRDYPFCHIYFAKYNNSRSNCEIHSVGLFYLNSKFPKNQLEYFDLIWIPSQEQLQECINNEPVVLLSKFNEFVFGDIEYVSQFIGSFRQLWLAFVMKEKYNKIWNGNDWIKKR